MFGGASRGDLERLVIASCWGSAVEAKDLLKFPTSAWMRESHRAIVDVIRRMLTEGTEINDLLVGFRLRETAPEFLEDFQAIHDYFASELGSIAGARGELLRKFREEYHCQTAWETLSTAARSMRTMPFDDWYRRTHEQFQRLAPTNGESSKARSFDQVYLARIEARLRGDTETGTRTRIDGLDRVLKGGAKPQQMILIVGASGTGKTVLAFQIVYNQSANDDKAAFFQLEMSEKEMADRALAMSTGLDPDELSPADLRKARANAPYLRNLFLYADHVTLAEYIVQADAHMYQHPDTKVIVTDYMGLLAKHKAGANTTTALNEVSAACKNIASAHKIAHIVNQQPSRQYLFDKHPSLEHIRDSGKIVDDAHAVLFIHYPYKFDKSMPENYTQIHVLKNRGGKAGGIIHIEWTPECYIMRPWTGDLPQPGDPTAGGRKLLAGGGRAVRRDSGRERVDHKLLAAQGGTDMLEDETYEVLDKWQS
jgi:archaellum biogenesis ATPase FlaH